MKLDGLLDALALPVSCRVDQRIPKKMLVDNGAPTAAGKRLLTDGIKAVQEDAVIAPFPPEPGRPRPV